MPSSKVVKGKI